MNHGELKVPSPFGRPSSDTQNLVLSELSLFILPQNIEKKILGLQYIGARLQYWSPQMFLTVWDPKGRTISWHWERRESRIYISKSNNMKSASPVYIPEINVVVTLVKIVYVSVRLSPPEQCYKN